MAGTITQTLIVLDQDNSNVFTARAAELLISWVADASDGSVPTLAIIGFPGWWITKAVTKPGTTQPTAAYDITLVDVDGADIAGAALADRSASAVEINKTLSAQIGKDGFTFTLLNNSVHSAFGTCRLFLNKYI